MRRSACANVLRGRGHMCHEPRVQQEIKLESLPALPYWAPYGLCLHSCLYPQSIPNPAAIVVSLKPKSLLGHAVTLLKTLQCFIFHTVKKSKVLTKNYKTLHDPALCCLHDPPSFPSRPLTRPSHAGLLRAPSPRQARVRALVLAVPSGLHIQPKG